MELSRDEFKAASLAAPVGWAYDSDERWRKLAAWKWRELCEAGGGGDKTHAPSLPLTNRGNRTIAAAIAFTFWPDYFDKQANAARAFGAPPPLLRGLGMPFPLLISLSLRFSLVILSSFLS